MTSGSEEVTGKVDLEGGKSYDLLVRYSFNPGDAQLLSLVNDSRGGVRIGVAPSKSVEEFVAEAVEVAKSVDLVVLLLGLNSGQLSGFSLFLLLIPYDRL